MILATGKTGARPAGETGDVWRCVDLGDEAFGVFEFMQIQGGHLVRATAMAMAMAMAAMMQAKPQGPWRSDKLFPALP